MKSSIGISNFLEEISSLSHSIWFPLFLCTEYWGRLSYLSLLYSWRLCIQMGISSLFSFAFHSLLFIAVCKASSDSHFAFLHFFFLGMVSITASCTMAQTSTHSSSGIQFIRSNPLNLLSLSLYSCKGFGMVTPVWSSGFPTFFNLSLNLAIKSSWSEPQSAPGLVFADCIEFFHLWVQRI